MGHVRNDSLIFSLRVLEELEQERIEHQRAEEAARQRALLNSQAEEERLRREAEARRARAEIARKREQALREHEEAARIQAMRDAIVEKGRVEAEWKGRVELETSQRAHAERMAELAVATHRRRANVFLSSTIATALVGMVLVGVTEARGRHARRLAESLSENLALERDSRARTKRLLELAESRNADLVGELEAARAHAERGPEDASEAVAPGEPRAASPKPRAPRTVESAPRTAHCGTSGDPLDACLPSARP